MPMLCSKEVDCCHFCACQGMSLSNFLSMSVILPLSYVYIEFYGQSQKVDSFEDKSVFPDGAWMLVIA